MKTLAEHRDASKEIDVTVRSYACEVIADRTDNWLPNGLRFRTKEAADAYGSDLASRWTAVKKYRVVPSIANPNQREISCTDICKPENDEHSEECYNIRNP